MRCAKDTVLAGDAKGLAGRCLRAGRLVGGNYIGMMPGKGKEQDHLSHSIPNRNIGWTMAI